MGAVLGLVWGFTKPVLFNRNFWFILALLGSVWFAYSWAYDRGASSRDPEVVALKVKLSAAEKTIEAAAITAHNQKVAYDSAITVLKAESAVTAAELKTKLDQSLARERKWKENRYATIPKYITPKADAGCVIPAGFVRLHNLSAAGLDPSVASEASRVPGSGPETPDSPTTAKLSTVGAVIADNYSECQSRLEVIEGWQMWYSRSFESWRKAIDASKNYVVVAPLEAAK